MNWWEVLNVDSNADLNKVRLAYLDLLKSNKPEENPEGFKLIRDAFEGAKHHLENHHQVTKHENPENPLKEWIENYQNFESRIQPESWQKLIAAQRELADAKIFTQLALGLFEFLLRNPYLPASIWKLLDGYFGWINNAERLNTYFSEDAVGYLLYRVEYGKWLPKIDSVKFPRYYSHEQTQTYFYHRDQVYRCLRNGEVCSTELTTHLKNSLSKVQDEEAFLMLFIVHGRQGEADAQVQTAKLYLDCFPDSVDAQQTWFQAMVFQKRHTDAIEFFQHTLEQQNPSLDALKMAASSAEATGNMTLAQNLYDKAIVLCPWDYEANFHKYLLQLKEVEAANDPVLMCIERAEVEAFRGYPDIALELLTAAAKEFCYRTDTKCIHSLEKLSLALLRLNAYAQLKDLLKPVIKTGTNNHVLLFCLAEAYRALLNPGKALDLLSQADETLPTLWSKSNVLLELRRYGEAKEVCTTLLNHSPADWTLYRCMGRCEEGLGNRLEALSHYQKLLELQPGEFACYCAVMDQALALGKMELLHTTFQQLQVREIAPQNVLDYWGVYAAGLDCKAKDALLK
ncbi:hypothetical protein EV673_2468 [Limnobacter thiooxidans]|uniref:J domain-containing protein n=1 Tax=Limnobacter thiooxidans TaxID=131080 RepID=A0AA86IY14_9BURK|nr:hypothetical protein EV673_2468 [Limnobacter thiooxidans]BET25457.1 hypothetical protein RGQ30_09580 [Limnobacter thiooxidans]